MSDIAMLNWILVLQNPNTKTQVQVTTLYGEINLFYMLKPLADLFNEGYQLIPGSICFLQHMDRIDGKIKQLPITNANDVFDDSLYTVWNKDDIKFKNTFQVPHLAKYVDGDSVYIPGTPELNFDGITLPRNVRFNSFEELYLTHRKAFPVNTSQYDLLLREFFVKEDRPAEKTENEQNSFDMNDMVDFD